MSGGKTSKIVISILCWIVVNLIYTPYEIYWCIKFYKQRTSLIIKKRQPTLLLGSFICSTIFWFGWLTFYVIIGLNSNIDNDRINVIISLIVFPFLIIQCCLTMTRAWLLYYRVNYNSGILRDKWSSIIDPTMESKDFFVRYKKTLGKWRKIKYVIIPWIILSILIATLVVGFGDKLYSNARALFWFCVVYIWILLLGVIAIGYIVLSCKLKKLDDHIGIRQEMKFIGIANAIITIVYIIWMIIGLIEARKAEKHWTSNNTEYLQGFLIREYFTVLISMFLMRTFIMFTHLRSTKYILTKYQAILRKYSSDIANKISHLDTYIAIASKEANQEDIEFETSMRIMPQVIKDFTMFDLFMKQLLKEHCSECLLSVIEMIQYQNIVYDVLLTHDERKNVNYKTVLILPDNCPQSYIIKSNDNDFVKMAIDIYNKYIKVRSEWEINIDYKTRHNLSKLIENEKEFRRLGLDGILLYHVFKPCLRQMMKLLSQSFTKFKDSDKYKQAMHYNAPSLDAYSIKSVGKAVINTLSPKSAFKSSTHSNELIKVNL